MGPDGAGRTSAETRSRPLTEISREYRTAVMGFGNIRFTVGGFLTLWVRSGLDLQF